MRVVWGVLQLLWARHRGALGMLSRALLGIVAMFSVACGSTPMRAEAPNNCDEAQYVGGVVGRPSRLSSGDRLISKKGLLRSSDDEPWFADSQQQIEARVNKQLSDRAAPQCRSNSASAGKRLVLAIPADLHARLVQAAKQTCMVSDRERSNPRYVAQHVGLPIGARPPRKPFSDEEVEKIKQYLIEALRKPPVPGMDWPVPPTDPAPVDEEPEPRAVDHPAVQRVGGMVAGATIAIVPFGALFTDVLMEKGILPKGTPEARQGKAFGELLVGGAQLRIACAGRASGGGVSLPPGAGAIASPIPLVGSLTQVNSALTVVVGARSWVIELWRADDSQQATGPSPSPAPAASPPAAKPPQAPPAAPAAELKPYGGKEGGGHHVPAKKAFEGAPNYDPNKALAIPNKALKEAGVEKHENITTAQRRRYKEFAATGQPLTWEVMAKIETEALVEAGMKLDMAKATVAKAIQALKDAGVAGPVRTPWGK
jgi:hypothetical protein